MPKAPAPTPAPGSLSSCRKLGAEGARGGSDCAEGQACELGVQARGGASSLRLGADSQGSTGNGGVGAGEGRRHRLYLLSQT